MGAPAQRKQQPELHPAADPGPEGRGVEEEERDLRPDQCERSLTTACSAYHDTYSLKLLIYIIKLQSGEAWLST